MLMIFMINRMVFANGNPYCWYFIHQYIWSVLDKLRALNLNSYVLQWLESYFMHWSQIVVVGGESSTPASVLSGVPQRSVLGPLLFLLYINGVTQVVTSNCALALYADDNLLFCEIVKWVTMPGCRRTLILCMPGSLNGSWNSISPNANLWQSPRKGQNMDNLFNPTLMALVSRGWMSTSTLVSGWLISGWFMSTKLCGELLNKLAWSNLLSVR